MSRIFAVLVCFACCCTTSAQQDDTHRQPPSLEILAPTIGRSVQQLTNEKTSLVPQLMVGERTVIRKWILERNFIEERATTSFNGSPQRESLAIYGFDEQQSVFRWWVFDEYGVASEFTGRWDPEDRTIEWKMARPRLDGYSHVAIEQVLPNGELEWVAKGTQRGGTLAVHQTGKTKSPPEPVSDKTEPPK